MVRASLLEVTPRDLRAAVVAEAEAADALSSWASGDRVTASSCLLLTLDDDMFT